MSVNGDDHDDDDDDSSTAISIYVRPNGWHHSDAMMFDHFTHQPKCQTAHSTVDTHSVEYMTTKHSKEFEIMI